MVEEWGRQKESERWRQAMSEVMRQAEEEKGKEKWRQRREMEEQRERERGREEGKQRGGQRERESTLSDMDPQWSVSLPLDACIMFNRDGFAWREPQEDEIQQRHRNSSIITNTSMTIGTLL